MWKIFSVPYGSALYKFHCIKKNTETLTDASKEVSLEINVWKTKYVLLSHHQNAGENRDMKTANRYFENLVQFRYLGMTRTKQNLIQEEISPQPFVFCLWFCGL
jgi:hypothetical protein